MRIAMKTSISANPSQPQRRRDRHHRQQHGHDGAGRNRPTGRKSQHHRDGAAVDRVGRSDRQPPGDHQRHRRIDEVPQRIECTLSALRQPGRERVDHDVAAHRLTDGKEREHRQSGGDLDKLNIAGNRTGGEPSHHHADEHHCGDRQQQHAARDREQARNR
jgi:hypothetical protein